MQKENGTKTADTKQYDFRKDGEKLFSEIAGYPDVKELMAEEILVVNGNHPDGKTMDECSGFILWGDDAEHLGKWFMVKQFAEKAGVKAVFYDGDMTLDLLRKELEDIDPDETIILCIRGLDDLSTETICGIAELKRKRSGYIYIAATGKRFLEQAELAAVLKLISIGVIINAPNWSDSEEIINQLAEKHKKAIGDFDVTSEDYRLLNMPYVEVEELLEKCEACDEDGQYTFDKQHFCFVAASWSIGGYTRIDMEAPDMLKYHCESGAMTMEKILSLREQEIRSQNDANYFEMLKGYEYLGHMSKYSKDLLVCLAPLATEEVIYGEVKTGSAESLCEATDLVMDMMKTGICGMKYVLDCDGEQHASRVRKANKILEKYYRQAVRILSPYKDLIRIGALFLKSDTAPDWAYNTLMGLIEKGYRTYETAASFNNN